MSASRRRRVTRLVEIATSDQQRAQAQVRAAAARVREVDDRRSAALSGAAVLADPSVPLGLRGHLTVAGSRHLNLLADNKAELVEDLGEQRRRLEQATSKVRSLERLGERLGRAEALEQQRRDAAELQDLVAMEAARERRVL